MSWFELSSGNILFAIAITFNILALYLIITRSRKEIGSYKYLLMTFLCTDSLFSLLHKLCQPVLSFRGGFFVSHCEGLIDSSFALTLYGASGSLAFPLLAYHFLYRAFVVSSSFRLQPMRHGRLLAALFAVVLLIEAAVDAAIREKILRTHENLANRTELIVIVPFIDGEMNMKVARNAWPLLAIAISSFVIIVISAWRITHVLYIHTSISLPTIALQRRMFVALIVQMLVPTVTMFAPSLTAIALPFISSVSLDIPDWVIGSCYALHPILDPIVITMCIRDYRIGLYELAGIYRRTQSISNRSVPSVSSLVRT